ncbi:acyl-CoA thioesterase [bacterium]|nr:acyl-CoA thioesterase [bacterium]
MKYIRETTVMYADTDSYQVVWHGSYLRWFEEGRYSFCKNAGIPLKSLEMQGITFPIIDMHVKYKAPAKIFDDIVIETLVSDVKSRTVTFSQTVKNKENNNILVEAEFVCTNVNVKEGRMQKFSKEIFKIFENSVE